jgi:hypothetical protein
MPVARQIDCLLGDGIAVVRNLECLESIAQFLDYAEANGLCTRVASQNGLSGSGSDFAFGSLGNNAWAYFEFDQGAHLFGLLIQATDLNNFGAAPGDPGQRDNGGTAVVGVQMAVREDGLSPWNGDTDNDGDDSKGDPVWTDGVSTCHVFPMSSNPAPSNTTLADYDHAVSRENCVGALSISTGVGYSRAHFWCNADGVFFTASSGNGTQYVQQFACGRYTPHSHMVSSCPVPYFMARSNSGNTGVFEFGPSGTVADQNQYGSRNGQTPEEGGVLARLADGVIRLFMFGMSTSLLSSTYQPNTLYPTPRYEVLPFSISAAEPYPINSYGGLGYLPLELYGWGDEMVNLEINAAATITAHGHPTTGTAKMVVSWDGGAAMSPSGDTSGGPLGRQSFTA